MNSKILLAFIFSCITATALAGMPLVLIDEQTEQLKEVTHKRSETKINNGAINHSGKAAAGGVKRAKNPRKASNSPAR
jgi:hypothetical protein